jgi:hypothetical protein
MPVRRMKTYTAESGYVYQYYFVGKRAALADEPTAPAVEYVFDVTTGHEALHAVSIFLRAEAMDFWASRNGHRLNDAEQYAAAKLRLFRGFDEVEDLLDSERKLAIHADEIVPLLESLRLAE